MLLMPVLGPLIFIVIMVIVILCCIARRKMQRGYIFTPKNRNADITVPLNSNSNNTELIPQNVPYPPPSVHSQSQYPPQHNPYPPQQAGYPPQQAGYPLQPIRYPPQQTGYPTQQPHAYRSDQTAGIIY